MQLWVGDGTKGTKHWVLATLAQLRLTARQRWPICFPLPRTTDRRESNIQTLWPYARSEGSACVLGFPQAENVGDQRPPTASRETTLKQQNEVVKLDCRLPGF